MLKSAIKEEVYSIIFAVVTALVGALILSLLACAFTFNQGTIKIVNQVLKTVAILLSSLMFLRGEKGLLKGLVVGVTTAFLTSLIASFFGANLLKGLLLDLIIFGAIGAVCGVIAVNVKNK